MSDVKVALKKSFMQAPIVEMNELNNLFFELTGKCCNLKCSHCFIKRNPFKKEKDFIPIEKVKQTLLAVDRGKLKSIYLTKYFIFIVYSSKYLNLLFICFTWNIALFYYLLFHVEHCFVLLFICFT